MDKAHNVGLWCNGMNDNVEQGVGDREIIVLDGPYLTQLREWIRTDQTILFYTSSQWKRLRAEVLKEQRNDCQCCKERGKHTRANHVHHVNYLRNRPELALSKWYVDTYGVVKRQLVAVCKLCHETVCHPERLRRNKYKPITKERW